MSQVSIIDIEGNNPHVATQYDADVDFAVPIANVLEILGDTTAAGSTPVHTTGSGNTITTLVQISQAIASTDATKVGLAAFNSSDFTVDANGFVSFAGSTVMESFNVDVATAPGTDPVTPDGSGIVTITGGQMAPETTANVIRTHSLAANSYTIQIQKSIAKASSAVGSNGVAHFNSTYFTVDGDGFVSLNPAAITVAFDVQANTAPGTDPVVPSALGVVTVNGTAVANHSVVLETRSRAANAYNLEIQYATSAAATDATKSGVAHFDSTQFSVDANGFVTLAGGGQAIDSIAVQTGTSPIAPTAAGLVTINGAVVAAGTNPVRTDGTGANTMAVEVQISQALAATDATKIGLANFDSAAFDVDANGFVQLNGGGIAATSFDVQANTGPGTDPVVPSAAGVVTVNGAAVANHSVVLETRSRAANAYNLEIQYSAAAAATDATKSGVAHFDSARFTVDANGFVSTSGTGIANTITGDAGGAISPTSGNWNILGGPGVTTSGSGSTLTINSVVFTDQGGSTSVTSDSGSFATAAITLTLPASPAQGELVQVVCTSASALVVDAPSTHLIRLGSSVTSAGGTVTSTAIGDSLTLRYRTSDTTWYATSIVGNWTIA